VNKRNPFKQNIIRYLWNNKNSKSKRQHNLYENHTIKYFTVKGEITIAVMSQYSPLIKYETVPKDSHIELHKFALCAGALVVFEAQPKNGAYLQVALNAVIKKVAFCK